MASTATVTRRAILVVKGKSREKSDGMGWELGGSQSLLVLVVR